MRELYFNKDFNIISYDATSFKFQIQFQSGSILNFLLRYFCTFISNIYYILIAISIVIFPHARESYKCR